MNGEFYKSVQTDIEDAVKYATSLFDAECDLKGDMHFDHGEMPRSWPF